MSTTPRTEGFLRSIVRKLSWAKVTQLFFQNFFLLLLGTISIAQYVVPLWLASRLFGLSATEVSGFSYLIGPTLFFCLNFLLIRTVRKKHAILNYLRPLTRSYFGFGLISAFCLTFLFIIAFIRGIVSLGPQLIAHYPPLEHFGSLWLQFSHQIFYFAETFGVSCIIILLLYGYIRGQKELVISNTQLKLLGWPTGLSPLKIVHISDIHIGANLTKQELATFVKKINDQAPDLIFITGDILDFSPDYIPEYFPYLGQLEAAHGVFACLGNHDMYAGAPEVVRGLNQHTNITVLRDSATKVQSGDCVIHIVGLDDRGKDWARGTQVHATLDELVAPLPQQDLTILLSHRPDIFPSAAEQGINLTLSGHTHGGQLALPFSRKRHNLARFITNFPRGLYSLRDSFLYVTQGLGVAGQRIRLFTPREIAVLNCAGRPNT